MRVSVAAESRSGNCCKRYYRFRLRFFSFSFYFVFYFFRFSFHYFSFLFSLTKITLYRGKGSLQASRLTQFFLLRKVNKKSDVLHQTLSKTAWSVPRDHFKTVSKYNL